MFSKWHCLENNKILFSPFFYCSQNKIKPKKTICFPCFFFSSRFHLFSSTVARLFMFLSFDSRFVKFKSNRTIAKRPLKRIQKTQGAKENPFFLFSLGFLLGFSRKSNEDEFSRKSNGGWVFLGIKRGLQGFCLDFLGNQMRMNFPGNRMGDGFSWESNRGCRVFAWIFSEIKRGWIFPEIEWGMDFLGNQTGVAKKKIIIITWLD